MKLNQKLLKEMVREVLLEAQDGVSPMESGLIDQIEAFITDLAQKEGVDLVKDRALIQRLLKMLSARILGPDADDPEKLQMKTMTTAARKKAQYGRLAPQKPSTTTGEDQ